MTTPAFVAITPGSLVSANGRTYRVTHLLTLNDVLAEDVATRIPERLRIEALRSPPPVGTRPNELETTPALEAIDDAEWAVAQRRFAAIKPLVDNPYRTRSMAEAAAASCGVNVGTIYEWMSLYLSAGHLSALIPHQRGRKRGTKLVRAEVEAIITSAIEDKYLNQQKRTPQRVIDAVKDRCKAAGIAPPHHNTVRKRIHALPVAATLRRRGRRDIARNLHEPVRGSFPGANFPLAVVQIDHTEADVILVDERTRRPMARPWVTLALDVFSRVVVGYHISIERPNAFAAGGCLSQAMLPKREVLAKLEVSGEWPVWGKMAKVHADNAREFKGAVLKRACAQYNIVLEMRPLKQPHYGGHVERLMGTAANEIRNLPGTTFSSPAARKGYDSEREAAMTLDEFEAYLIDFIVNVYHKRFHSGIGTSPIRQWEIGIVGDEAAGVTPMGLPAVPSDPARVRLDFMPFKERTVQPYGILIDDVHYWDEVLTPWINAIDPQDSKRKRKFIVRRDPRLISPVWFWDPEVERYFEIPYRDTTRPPMSLWELRAARALLVSERREHIDETALFEAAARLEQRIEDAKEATKSVRRQAHRQEQTRRASIKSGDKEGQLLLGAKGDAAPSLADPLDELFATPVERFHTIDVRRGGVKPE